MLIWCLCLFGVGLLILRYLCVCGNHVTGKHVTVRLSTPEWYIRSMPALASDRVYCNIIGASAVSIILLDSVHAYAYVA